MTVTTTRARDEEYYEFERSVGVAGPYRYVTCFDIPGTWLAEANPTAYQNALRELGEIQRSLGVSGGCCQRCGMPLTYNHVLEGEEGRRFVVGSDCLLKRGRITSEAKEAQKRIERARAAARTRAYRQKRWKQFLLKIDAVDFVAADSVEHQARDLHFQMAREAEQRRRTAEAQVAKDQNEWLIDVLHDGRGGFCDGMCRDLEKKALSGENFSDRQLQTMVEIYAKRAGGRANSKAWRAACEEFGTRSGMPIEVVKARYGSRSWEWFWVREEDEDEDDVE